MHRHKGTHSSLPTHTNTHITTVAELKKFGEEGCCYVLTKRTRSARRPTEGQSFEVPGDITPGKFFLKLH